MIELPYRHIYVFYVTLFLMLLTICLVTKRVKVHLRVWN